MKNRSIIFAILSLSAIAFKAQTYSPVASSGYNIDAIAETSPNSQAQTTQALDWSNNVMYSVNFRTGAGFACGGVLNSGTIVSGTRTYQLQPFNTNNAVYIATGNTRTINITTPAQYSLISLLVFSTEGMSNVNITFNYTNATTTNFGAFGISDWFFAGGAVYSNFGRCTRVTSGSTADGCPTDPRFYPLDFSLSCADQQKNLASITITTTSGNQGAYVMAVSGLAYAQTNTVSPVTQVSCNGGTNGSATANITGGNSPFTYSWNTAPVQNTATASNLAQGNYTCTVTDNKGCQTTTTVSITQPGPLTLTLTPVNASCGVSNGSIAAASGGGTPTYNYGINGGALSTNGNFTNLGAGNYTVNVQDNNGCQATATASITASASPNVTVSSGTICSGGSTTLTANGGTTYTWSPATGLSSTNGATVTANPTVTTTYTVSGSTGGCSGSATSTVTVNASAAVNVNSATFCAGGSATLTATGAGSYTWSPAGGLSSTTGSNVTANPVTTTVYTVTGGVGTCTANATSTVTVNALPVLNVNSASICSGQQTATLTANGANIYSWLPATGLSATTGNSVNATPGATTIYTVTGTDANACVSTITSTVTVNALPNVTVNSALICNGNNATLTANGAVTYNWSPGTGLSATTGNSATANPATTTVYTISGTDANTCTNTATSTVTVVNNPAITVNNATICQGQQTATLTANGATSYNWSPATGLSSTSGTSVTAAPGTTTTYTITGAVGTCTAVTTATVAVNALPTVTATSTLVCNGNPATLTANGANTYTWSTMVTGNSISVSPSSTTTYSVAGTDGNGCFNFTTATVTVSPLPNVTVNSTAICSGNSAVLTANNSVVFTWSPATDLSGSVGSSVTASPVSTTQYTVTGTDANGCSNTALSTVTVNALPTVIASSGLICAGKNLILSATGANTYNWNPSTGLSNANIAGPTASPAATTVYTVTGTSINGCQGTTTATVTVNALPVVSITPQNSSGCVPVCVTFSNTGGSANNTYLWNFGNGTSSTATSAQSCYANAGTYTASLLVTDNNGCANTASAVVNAYPIPTAEFSYNPQTTTIFDPNIQFHDLSTGANINTWTWYFGDGDSSQTQNPLHTYSDTGLFYPHLIITSDHGCWNTFWQALYISPEFLIYVPNAFSPNSDNTNDIFMPKGEGITEYKLSIFDRWGNKLFQSDDIYKGWDGMKGDQTLQEDVYVWNIELKNIKGEPKRLSGTVSLLK